MKKLKLMLLSAALVGFGAVVPEANAATANNSYSAAVQPQHRQERRRRHRGIGRAFGKAGKSAGRGGRDFGRDMARGKPIKASRRLGKGLGGFGKHTGQGTLRIGRRANRTVRRVIH